MKKLLIHSTQTAAWHALVNEAESLRKINLEVELESYLVFLLMRFSERPELAASVLGLDFLESAQQIDKKPYLLKEVGDKCLLHAGLFPEHARKRRVTPEYFVKLGKMAYSTLAVALETNDSDLFETICGYFVPMIEVLSATREVALSAEEYTLLNTKFHFEHTQH